jgi:VanZ family protein
LQFQCDFWPAAGGCAALAALAVAAFYFALVFSNLAYFKVSYIGDSFFGWRIDRNRAVCFVMQVGVLLTYYAFACRVVMISAIEALFLGILFTGVAGNRLRLFDTRSQNAWWWISLTVVALLVHMWSERAHLGRAALVIERTKRT